jgi:hypothetical protein
MAETDTAGSIRLGSHLVHRMGYGAMHLLGPGVFGPPRDRDGALAVLREAAASGVDQIETSDYCGPHVTNRICSLRMSIHFGPHRRPRDDTRGSPGVLPAGLQSSELKQFLARNASAELLRTAAFSDTAQIDGGETEALDEINDGGPRRDVIARDEQDATAARRRWIFPKAGRKERVERLHHAGAGNGAGNDLCGRAPSEIARRKGGEVDRIRRVDHDATVPFDTFHRVGDRVERDRQYNHIGAQGLRGSQRPLSSPSLEDDQGRRESIRCRTEPPLTQYRTRFEERIQSECAEFAPDARLLEAAEWGERFMRRGINNDASGLQLAGHPLRVIDVGREYVGLQPVAGVVGDRDRFGFVAIGDDAQHRPENLLARNPHLVGHKSE